MLDYESDAYDAGFRATCHGAYYEVRDSNPYPTGSSRYNEYNRGMLDGHQDYLSCRDFD